MASFPWPNRSADEEIPAIPRSFLVLGMMILLATACSTGQDATSLISQLKDAGIVECGEIEHDEEGMASCGTGVRYAIAQVIDAPEVAELTAAIFIDEGTQVVCGEGWLVTGSNYKVIDGAADVLDGVVNCGQGEDAHLPHVTTRTDSSPETATGGVLDDLDEVARCMGSESYQHFVDDPEGYDSESIGGPEC